MKTIIPCSIYGVKYSVMLFIFGGVLLNCVEYCACYAISIFFGE